MQLSVVIVSWNCREHLEACLDSLRVHCQVPLDVIVVDNASTDSTAEMLKERFPAVRLIQNDENVGFSKANNVGIRASSGPYLALINPDVKLLPGCLDRAIAAIADDESIGILGPAMIGRDGVVHRSGMRLPSLWNSICDAFALHHCFGRRPLFGGQAMADFDWQSRRDVEVLNGWFWLIRREALGEVGLLDERFFMYGEDLDWCKRFLDKGWRVVFEPAASAIHYGGGSAEQAPTRFHLEQQKANLQYWSKHHPPITQSLYIMILIAHNLLRIAGYSGRRLVSPGDAEAQFKVTLYMTCLKQLLARGVR